MSMTKNVNLLVGVSLLLTLVSCGNDKKSKTHQATSPICSEIDCLSSVNWRIQLQGRSFPDKSRVDINGTTVLNECVSKQKYSIDRTSQPEILYLDNYFVPKKGELKIDIIDMGYDCDSESVFLSQENVPFDVVKAVTGTEISISL